MQGMKEFIPTEKKAAYINALLRVGFNTLDFGSFVSPKAIPQMADTEAVLQQLAWQQSKTKLLAIVANTRGAESAAQHEGIRCLGFPLSVSETFQQRNTNRSVNEALYTLEEIKNICLTNKKELVVYISMGFGNPYGDAYHVDMVYAFTDKLVQLGADVISLADTLGAATPQDITTLFTAMARHCNVPLGVHLHTKAEDALAKIDAAYRAGCRRMDGALKGFGGCPMAADELVGNVATETIVQYAKANNVPLHMDMQALSEALAMANEIFLKH